MDRHTLVHTLVRTFLSIFMWPCSAMNATERQTAHHAHEEKYINKHVDLDLAMQRAFPHTCVARYLLKGSHATPLTKPWCFFSVAMREPDATSHTMTMLSRLMPVCV